MEKYKILVVLSGGQDSTTALFWAKERWPDAEIHALTFNYGQRHALEIEAASTIGRIAGVASHEFVNLGPILKGTSPLTDHSREVEHYASADALPGGLEKTFVPGRNILFLTLAGNRAYVLGAKVVVMGLCEEDYGGYPDCRKAFVQHMESALGSGLYGHTTRFTVECPLMHLTKRETVELAARLPGCLDALAYSHTCYDGQYPPNPYNHASLLRARGFAEAGIPDPLIVRAKNEGRLPADYPDSGLVEGTAYDGKTPSPSGYAMPGATDLSEDRVL